MKIALNQMGHLVRAEEATRGHQYVCPACQAPVRFCQGRKKVPYFAHQCAHRGEGETDEHQLGKEQLYRWAELRGWQPQLEVYLPEIKQRADLLVQVGGQPIALEFQCSGLSSARLAQRNAGYRQMGIQPIWLLGSPYCRRLQRAKQAQFTHLHGGVPQLLFWDVASAQLRRWQGRVGPSPHQLTFKVRRPRDWQLLNKIYTAGHLPIAVPAVARWAETNWPLTKLSLYEWHLHQLLALEQERLGRSWHLSEWLQAELNRPQWLALPSLLPAQVQALRQQLLGAWLQQLAVAGIIRLNGHQLTYQQPPRWEA